MNSKKEYGSILLMTVVMVLLVACIAASLFSVVLAASRRERAADDKLRSRELALAARDLSIANLRQVTDGADNDGDGQVDEFIEFGVDILDPLVYPSVEGRLGRIGIAGWTPADDLDRDGHPDFGERGVAPVPMAGGSLLAYTVFSQGDGFDNNGDGQVDEPAEAGFVTVVALGRFGSSVTSISAKGKFTDLFAPPLSPTWSPDAAMLCGGNLGITGTASFAGAQADVHANGTLTLSGTCSVSGDATAAEGLSRSGSASVSGIADGNAPRAAIPYVHPPSIRSEADFVLLADGRVQDRWENVIHDAARSGSFRGWTPVAGGWRFSGNGQDPALARGVYYVCGDAAIAGTGQSVSVGNSGGGTQTFFLSVIATGSVQVSGNTRLQACHPAGLLFVAGGDLRVTGTPSLDQLFQGVLAAHEQVHIGGTPEIQGAVVAQDGGRSAGLNTENLVPGTPLITYDGGLNTNLALLDPRQPWFLLDPKILSYEER
jgi:hypothetical protein